MTAVVALPRAFQACLKSRSTTSAPQRDALIDCVRHPAGGGGADQPTGHCPTQSRAAVGFATPPGTVGPGGAGGGQAGNPGTSSAGGKGGNPVAQYGGGGVNFYFWPRALAICCGSMPALTCGA